MWKNRKNKKNKEVFMYNANYIDKYAVKIENSEEIKDCQEE